jgi:hypothetical protein
VQFVVTLGRWHRARGYGAFDGFRIPNGLRRDERSSITAMLAVHIESPPIARARLWSLIEWCHSSGADEFSFLLACRGFEEFEALHRQIGERLDSFARADEPRVRPLFCIWEPSDQVSLYHLTYESIPTVRSQIR